MEDLWRESAVDIVDLVKSRKVSAAEVTQASLDRLQQANGKLNAVVIQTQEDAFQSAQLVDQAIQRGEDPGELAGVPVTVKVNIDQAGYATTNGLKIQENLIAEQDSPVVTNFRKAGAIIIGRTNTPAFSLRWFTRNQLHGHTINPHNSNITPGGSSGGAASATAAGIGAIGHGTDIGGSVRYPAYACGIQGLRPSQGRFPAWNPSSKDRHIGAQLMAVSGPLTRSIADLELATKVMSKPDLRDPCHVPLPYEMGEFPRRVAFCVAPDGMQTKDVVERFVRQSAERLRDAGWKVEEVESPPFLEPARLQAILWLAEMHRVGKSFLEKEGDPDAIHVFGEMIKLSPIPTINDVLDALQARLGFLRTWQLFHEKYPVLICPTSSEPPFPDLLDLEDFPRVIEAQLTQVGLPLMGIPGLSIFTGYHQNANGKIPMGAQLVGARFREDILIAAAKEIEVRSPKIEIAAP
jgi:amidase